MKFIKKLEITQKNSKHSNLASKILKEFLVVGFGNVNQSSKFYEICMQACREIADFFALEIQIWRQKF